MGRNNTQEMPCKGLLVKKDTSHCDCDCLVRSGSICAVGAHTGLRWSGACELFQGSRTDPPQVSNGSASGKSRSRYENRFVVFACFLRINSRESLGFSGMAGVRLADLNGPKWTISGQNGPFWSISGPSNAIIQFGTRSF